MVLGIFLQTGVEKVFQEHAPHMLEWWGGRHPSGAKTSGSRWAYGTWGNKARARYWPISWKPRNKTARASNASDLRRDVGTDCDSCDPEKGPPSLKSRVYNLAVSLQQMQSDRSNLLHGWNFRGFRNFTIASKGAASFFGSMLICTGVYKTLVCQLHMGREQATIYL